MLSVVSKFLTKRIIPFIISKIELDIDTVQKETGTYLRARVELLGYILLDRLIPITEADPIDVYESALQDPRLKQIERAFTKRIKTNES